MFNYKDVLNNKTIKEEYQKTDSVNPYPFNHGLQHINNVCNIMDKLTDVLGIKGEEKEALLIACAIHDVGQSTGREHHGLKARKIAEQLFDNELRKNSFYSDMLSAIENHDNKCSIDYPLFTILVQFSDKMDFTKKRLEKDYKEKFGYRVFEDFNDIEFIYNSEYFGINILSNNVEDIVLKFYRENFTPKIINAVKVLATKLNLKPIIKINNNDISLNNYIILHGSFGSSDGNWFPWLKQELENKTLNVKVPQMPVGVGNQNYENWKKEFKKLLIDEGTTIIAHSIAPIFVCKYLITNKIKVKKLIFVCGFNNYEINEEYDAVNRPMFIDNYKDVKNYCDDIICYYSDNDPYVSFENEKEFADTISNKQYVIHNGGHINAEFGYTEFKEILKHL